MADLRWGILATGGVAQDFCSDLVQTPGNSIAAVVSRDIQKASAFAQRYAASRAYDHYAEMLQNPEVDVIYIATPHVFHYDNAIQALNAGKHVVCEKPIAMSPNQVQALVELARAKGLLLLEAVWMAFFPTVAKTRQWLLDGRIGAPVSFEANFDFAAPYDPEGRLFDLSLGGGALMDIGLYPLFMATKLFGKATVDMAHCVKSETGADIVASLSCTHTNGANSRLSFSFVQDKPCEARVFGETGYIQLHDRFFCGKTLTLHPYFGQAESQTLGFTGHGYGFEIAAAREAILQGQIECPQYTHQMMLENHLLLDAASQALGIRYDL